MIIVATAVLPGANPFLVTGMAGLSATPGSPSGHVLPRQASEGGCLRVSSLNRDLGGESG